MVSSPDKARDEPAPTLTSQPDLPRPPVPEADGHLRRQLADRLARATDAAPNLSDLKKRAESLPAGHPSSPYNGDGTRRSPEPSPAAFERTVPPLNDADWADHVRHVARLLDKALAHGLATHVNHTVDAGHEIWTAERSRLHGSIIAEFYGRADDVPCQRHAIMAGGLAGAGKSTVLDHHAGIDRSRFLTIDPDQFKEILAERGLVPEIPGVSPMEATALAHRESSYLARRLALRAMADGKNVIWDITMSSAERTACRLDELRNAGYDRVDAIFVDVSVDASIARAEARHRHDHDRYLSGQGLGGRCVPAPISRSQADAEYGSVNHRVFETLKDHFDHWALYDNSVHGRLPLLVAHSHWPSTDIGLAEMGPHR